MQGSVPAATEYQVSFLNSQIKSAGALPWRLVVKKIRNVQNPARFRLFVISGHIYSL